MENENMKISKAENADSPPASPVRPFARRFNERDAVSGVNLSGASAKGGETERYAKVEKKNNTGAKNERNSGKSAKNEKDEKTDTTDEILEPLKWIARLFAMFTAVLTLIDAQTIANLTGNDGGFMGFIRGFRNFLTPMSFAARALAATLGNLMTDVFKLPVFVAYAAYFVVWLILVVIYLALLYAVYDFLIRPFSRKLAGWFKSGRGADAKSNGQKTDDSGIKKSRKADDGKIVKEIKKEDKTKDKKEDQKEDKKAPSKEIEKIVKDDASERERRNFNTDRMNSGLSGEARERVDRILRDVKEETEPARPESYLRFQDFMGEDGADREEIYEWEEDGTIYLNPSEDHDFYATVKKGNGTAAVFFQSGGVEKNMDLSLNKPEVIALREGANNKTVPGYVITWFGEEERFGAEERFEDDEFSDNRRGFGKRGWFGKEKR